MDLACKYGGGGAAPRAAMGYAKSPFATGDRDRQRFRPATVSALGAGPTPVSTPATSCGMIWGPYTGPRAAACCPFPTCKRSADGGPSCFAGWLGVGAVRSALSSPSKRCIDLSGSTLCQYACSSYYGRIALPTEKHLKLGNFISR